MAKGVLSNVRKSFSPSKGKKEADTTAAGGGRRVKEERAVRRDSLQDLALAIIPPTLASTSTCTTDLGLGTETNETAEEEMAQDADKDGIDDRVAPDASLFRSDSSAVSVDSGIATPPISNSKGGGGGGPSVSFAPSPEGRLSSVLKKNADNKGDLDVFMQPDELVKTMKEVRTSLDQARIDLSAEKAIRKRKEKNLVKLAKQLNMRTSTIEEQTKQVESLVSSSANLETRLDSSRRDLEELSDRHEKATRDHHAEITAQQAKHRDLCREHDSRISELTTSHSKQCEDLRREVLATKLETDRLRMRLASAEMEKNPSGAAGVIERTLRESMTNVKSGPGAAQYAAIALSLLVIPLLAFGYQRDLLSVDALCAPCVPGTTFGDGAAESFDAPWWAPASSKAAAFGLLCGGGGRPRTRIEWSGGTGGKKLLAVTDLDNGSSKNRLFDKRASSAIVASDSISVTSNHGKTEKVGAPWNT